jgi:hypothetical protein
LVTDLEETEARNDCAGEDQQQFNRPTDKSSRNSILADHDRAQWGRVRRRKNSGHHKNCIKTRAAKLSCTTDYDRDK